jgi:hypothetical protein
LGVTVSDRLFWTLTANCALVAVCCAPVGSVTVATAVSWCVPFFTVVLSQV